MKTFLQGLGFSAYEIEILELNFGRLTVDFLETAEGRERLSSVVDRASVKAAHIQFTRIWNGTSLYSMLEPFGIPTGAIYKLFEECGENEKTARKKIEENPYILVTDFGSPFPAVDDFASSYLAEYRKGYLVDNDARARAAVCAVLTLAEEGTEEFGQGKLLSRISEIAGSTCLPYGELISLAQLMLGDETAPEEITSAAEALHREKKILLTKKKGQLFAYRASTADDELSSASLIHERVARSEDACAFSANPYQAIDKAQASMGLYLSHEQVDAVCMAVTSYVSVITGGPGTGKTQTLRVLLETFRRLYGGDVLLMAPTGQAAKRMAEATGYPASTIHLALGIMPGEKDYRSARALSPGLLVVDEASMLDSSLLRILLQRASEKTRIVFVGDPDQLPSIGAGNVLSELVKCVPVSKLTKIFRQDGDAAEIAYNAARIKAGTTKMIESERFSFVERGSSEEIQKAICDIYAKETKEYGMDNVIVLSPLRHHTKTGVNKLNAALRRSVSDETRYLSHEGTRFYLNDKIVFLKNRLGLVNGQIGYVESIGRDSLTCRFGETKISLSGTELSWIDPAYAETIHKSQGDEYPVVILVADPLHRSTKPMTYTAITRSKEKVVVVGSKSAFENAITNQSAGRFSCLSAMANS